MVVSSAAVFGMSRMQTFQKTTAEESTWVRTGERCEAKMFSVELTLRTTHVLFGRINYPTGRISECRKLSYRVFIIGLISATLSSPAYIPPREVHRFLSRKRLVIEPIYNDI